MGYRTRELAQVVGLTGAQVRSYVYKGLLEPSRGSRREYQYSFHDLMLLRIGTRLARGGVPLTRIAAALHALKPTRRARTSLEPVRLATSCSTARSTCRNVRASANGSE